MAQAELNPVNFLKESFNRVGPVFVPLVIMLLPGAILQVVAALLPGPLSIPISLLGTFLVTPIMAGAAIYLLSQHLNNQQPDVSEAIQRAMAKAIDLILAYFLAAVILAIGSLLLFVPGIYLSVRLVFSLHTVMLQDAAGSEALGVSWRMTEGKWLSIFLCLLVMGVVLIVPIVVVTVILTPFDSNVVAQLLSSIVGLAIGPVFGMYGFLMYKTLRQMNKGDSINRAIT